MKAIQVVGFRQMKVVEAPTPVPEDEQLLVRAEYLSICGSDMRLFRRPHPEEMYPFPPGVPCHEVIGVVQEGKAPGVSPGQRVIALPVPPRQGARGMGGGGEYMVTVPGRVIPLPAGADPYTYMMCQPVGTVLFAVQKLGNILGKRAVVVGQGAIGLAFTTLLRRMGAREVVALDHHDYRLAIARARGATITLNPERDDVVQAVSNLTHGQGAEVVVEACGTPDSIDLLADLVCRYGTIILFGLPETDVVEVNYLKLMRRMPTIIPTVSGSSEDPARGIREAVSLVAQGDLDVSWMVTHRLPFTEAPRAYELYEGYLDGVIKVVMQV